MQISTCRLRHCATFPVTGDRMRAKQDSNDLHVPITTEPSDRGVLVSDGELKEEGD